MLKGFKRFHFQGNIIDLSVAVVIGTAFTGLVTKFTDSIIQPLINRIGAGRTPPTGSSGSASAATRPSTLNVLLSAAINFLLVALVLYFLVVLPYSKIRAKEKDKPESDAAKTNRLLTEIRDSLVGTDTSSGDAKPDK